MDGDGADDFITSMTVVLQDIDVPRVEKFDEFCFKVVLLMVVDPVFLQDFTIDLQLLPVALFVVDFAHYLHSSESSMIANM